MPSYATCNWCYNQGIHVLLGFLDWILEFIRQSHWIQLWYSIFVYADLYPAQSSTVFVVFVVRSISGWLGIWVTLQKKTMIAVCFMAHVQEQQLIRWGNVYVQISPTSWCKSRTWNGNSTCSYDCYLYNVGVSENSVPLNPMVLLIIIPIKWL